MESSIPEEIVYADDCDFITEMEKTKNKIYEKSKEIMTSKNLLVDEEKIEYTTVKRGSKEEGGKELEKCGKTGIKGWWSARLPEKKRIVNYSPSK